jgi:hypothetical protein
MGVTAKPVTASTIRSNSRARRALVCIGGNRQYYRTNGDRAMAKG